MPANNSHHSDHHGPRRHQRGTKAYQAASREYEILQRQTSQDGSYCVRQLWQPRSAGHALYAEQNSVSVLNFLFCVTLVELIRDMFLCCYLKRIQSNHVRKRRSRGDRGLSGHWLDRRPCPLLLVGISHARNARQGPGGHRRMQRRVRYSILPAEQASLAQGSTRVRDLLGGARKRQARKDHLLT